ncbi:MAG: hypothetical protein PHU00_10395 [Bacteroidales bacterium]|nr:hypothetical protein [Bacteroidales bacterium]
MKHSFFIFLVIIFLSPNILTAQETPETPVSKYRRSSLCTILMESERFPMKDTVIRAYYDAPFPDKYNDHSIGIKSFNPKQYPITEEERTAAGIKMGFGRKMNQSYLDQNKDQKTDPGSYDDTLIIRKFFNDQKIANKIVAKWFNRQEDGSFNIDLVSERGLFDASFLDTKTAFASADGISLLKTAGLDLIYNTFLVVSKMNFISNELPAAVIREAAILGAKEIKNELLQAAALVAAEIAYNKAKEGYSVWTTSYLYQIEWNDSIQHIFYNDLYVDADNTDPVKKAIFDTTSLFRLKFVGDEKSSSLVTFSIKNSKRTEEQTIKLSTIRNIDAVYAKLQKKYEVFMPQTPLYTGYPITAKIGMKEGLEGGEKFEVFEQVMDPNTGKIELKSKGKIEVDKRLIWDNRYILGDEDPDRNVKKEQKIDRTTFKGGKDYYPGLLIKQIK